MPHEVNLRELIADLYLEGRELIGKDLAGVGANVASWPGPDSAKGISIRALVVHLAGFDNLVRAALGGEDAGALVRDRAWQAEFGSGFPRELRTLDPGIAVPEPPPLDGAVALLGAQTAATLAVLDSGIDLAAARAFPDDDDLFTTGRAQPVQAARLALWVPMHDRYHRGHITHTKYDYRIAGGR